MSEAKVTSLQKNIIRYDSLDGLRTISALFIVMMHVYVNFGHKFDLFVFSRVISSFGQLPFLFMALSGFSMCCGYYEKIISGNISIAKFYEKRYAKILPFFACITLLDIVVAPSVNSIYEGFANVTLAFGLLPNADLQVIGMGWTLGTIFVFYMLFPFFCFMLKSKKSAWCALGVTIIYNYLCLNYFFDANHVLEGYWKPQSIIYCSMFFVMGGLVYLYRDKLYSFAKKYSMLMLLVGVLLTILFYVLPSFDGIGKNLLVLIIFAAWLIYGLNEKNIVLNNPITKFISGISLEIYLSHMIILRVVEKLHLDHLFGKSVLSYVVMVLLTITLTVVFATVAKWVLEKASALVRKRLGA